jgi:hypothetical protein
MWPPVLPAGDLGADPDGDTPTHAGGAGLPCPAPVASADHLVVADVAVVFFERTLKRAKWRQEQSGID